MKRLEYRCAFCGSDDVEYCIPAWFTGRGEFTEPDSEAEIRTTFCNKCERSGVPLRCGDREITGRWDAG